jgi:hypothetical protein
MFTELTLGHVFARDFRIVRPLAQGGMGAVFVALQLSTGSLRAMKVIPQACDGRQEPRAVRARSSLETSALCGVPTGDLRRAPSPRYQFYGNPRESHQQSGVTSTWLHSGPPLKYLVSRTGNVQCADGGLVAPLQPHSAQFPCASECCS